VNKRPLFCICSARAAAACIRDAGWRVHPGWRCVNAVSAALRSSAEASRELPAPLHRLPHFLDLADGISGRNAVPDSPSSAEPAPAAAPPPLCDFPRPN
jgi:hypothetical protein